MEEDKPKEPANEPAKEPTKKPMNSLFKNKWARITFLGMAGLILIVWVATALSKP